MAAFKFPFKSLSAYRLTPEFLKSTEEQVRERVQEHKFHEDENGPVSEVGWAQVREDGDPVYVFERHFLLRYRVAKKVVPTSVVRETAKRRAAKIEQQQGYKPGRKQMKDIKEEVSVELAKTALVQTSDVLVWFDLTGGWLFLDSASGTKCDAILELIAKTFEPFPAQSLQVDQAPASAMTEWLGADEAPEGFTLDQEMELQSHGESRASVRYLRETPLHEDVTRQIASGKQCVRAALTWKDRVSFVLTDDLTLKRITALDIVSESYENDGEDDARFQSMFALFSGEIRALFDDVVQALGGEVSEQ